MRYKNTFLFICALLATFRAAGQRTGVTSPLPPDVRFTMTGSSRVLAGDHTEGATKPSSFNARAKPSQLVLPTLSKRQYDQQDIQNTLNDLFSNWAPAAAEYAFYFILMPQNFDIKAEAVTLPIMSSLPPDTVAILTHYNVPGFPNTGISLIKPGTIVNCDPFKINQPPDSSSGPNDAIFVKLDGFNAPVPIPIARLVEADFVRGFVTRLVLEAYSTVGSTYENASGLSTVKLSLGSINPTAGAFLPYIDSATYKAYPSASTVGNMSFQNDLSGVAQGSPVAPVALLWGWEAASKLLKSDSFDHKLQRDVLKLLSYRYSFQQIGMMTGYTLDYLAGTAENSRIKQIAGGTTVAPVKDPSQIITQAATDKAVTGAKNLVVSFGNVMTAEFYAVSQNHRLSATDRVALLTKYSNFIDGYRRGVSLAVDDIYNQVADITYGIGYQNGFTDGYAAGYAAGWADGYAQGNADAWKAADQTINNLEQQIGSLQQQLTQATSGGGGGGGFWNTVGTIGSDIGTAIGVIGSLF